MYVHIYIHVDIVIDIATWIYPLTDGPQSGFSQMRFHRISMRKGEGELPRHAIWSGRLPFASASILPPE